jgi:DEAD/DEAH box helicase domain-containing protein
VKVTKEVHEFGAKNGFVKFNDKNGREQKVAVKWSLD